MHRRSASMFLFTLLLSAVLSGEVERPAAGMPEPEQFQAAKAAMSEGKYPKAIAIFKKILKQHKDCSSCWIGMGYSYFVAGSLHEADECANKALLLAALDSDKAVAHNLKGEISVGRGNDPKTLAESEAQFREAVRLAPDDANFHLNLARCLLRQSKDDKAMVELNECLQQHPSPAAAHLAKRFLADPRRGREDIAPDFDITTLQGDHISLSQLAGKMVVLDFWATWCPPCRDSVPELKELTRKYQDGLVVISISGDDDEGHWREFVSKHEMTWHQFRDSNHFMLRTFGVHAFPTYLVLDGEGVIRQRTVGRNPQETIVHHLKQFLAGVPQLASK